MSTESIFLVTAATRSGDHNQAKLKMIVWSPKERMIRATKACAIGFGCAIAFIFLPIVHFVLVPLAIIATPFIAWITYKQTELIPKQNISCPKCAAQIQWQASPKIKKIDLFCDTCRNVIEVQEDQLAEKHF